MKYSVIDMNRQPSPKVLLTYPYEWMATLMSKIYGGDTKNIHVAETPTDPQEIIDICVHRDQANAQAIRSREIMFGLVAKDDDGAWTTVHESDKKLSDEDCKSLDEIFGC